MLRLINKPKTPRSNSYNSYVQVHPILTLIVLYPININWLAYILIIKVALNNKTNSEIGLNTLAHLDLIQDTKISKNRYLFPLTQKTAKSSLMLPNNL